MCSFGILIFTLVFFFALWTVEGSRQGCPSSVLHSRHFAKVHNSTCYLFVDRERYWEDARDSCRRMGGAMLTVQDYSTMRFIRSVLNSQDLGWNKQGVWLGARYSGRAWRWTSGERVGYANWAPGEPSQILGLFSVEDCALMRRHDNWRWHDYICGNMKYHYNYICQFPVQKTISKTTTTTTTTTTSTVLKPGLSPKKGHFLDGKDSQLEDYESFQRDMGHESGSHSGVSHPPHGGQGGGQGFPYDSQKPGSSDRGYNEVHSTSQVFSNGNLTILTIILVTGGIVLLILLMIFLIIRKRYNYKKAMGQPSTVHFENRNYNNAHNNNSSGGSAHHHHHPASTPLPPPPAPHTFHRAPIPLPPSPPPLPVAPRPTVPPRPLNTLLPLQNSQLAPRRAEGAAVAPRAAHLPTAYVPHSRPASDLYLTPMEIGGGEGVGGGGVVQGGSDGYEEIPAYSQPMRKLQPAANLSSSPARRLHVTPGASRVGRQGGEGGGGGGRGGGEGARRYPMQHEDSATIPLMSATGCPWNQSDDSLNEPASDPMTSSLTTKTSSIHNDYVDMNGSPVVPARRYRQHEAGTSKEGGEGKTPAPTGESLPALEPEDPKSELSLDGDSPRPDLPPEDSKHPAHSEYSNLMTTSQERCENLYAQLH